MTEAAVATRPARRTSIRTALLYALFSLLAVHAVVLLPFWHSTIAISRILTAAAPLLAALCIAWRAQHLEPRERSAWRWLVAALLFWSAGQVVETWLGQSNAASNLAVDASDFFYLSTAFPLLLAISSTRQTETIRAVFALDFAQVSLALVLTWVRLFNMKLPADHASTEMLWIYAAECLLLAAAAVLRLATWSTLEERRRVRLLCTILWIYLPIELGMDYATRKWDLHAGTLLDLLWSVPFIFGGWRTLNMPADERPTKPGTALNRSKLMVESLCPLLFTVGVFSLAASIASQHAVLALSAIFLLLVIQGLHAGLVQLNFLTGRKMLLERELELETANTTLQELSMLDPLTGIPNRRRFTGVLEEAWKRAIRTRESVAVLMIDVDYFKGVNDLHGHTYGDECLNMIARALGQAGRSNDLLARYGGEEFVLLLPETSAAGAMTVAERIQHAVGALAIRNDASPFDRRLTISIGLGVSSPVLGMNPANLVDMADKALYEAKHGGRNMICARTLEPVLAANDPGLSGLS
jgi:diguanylate cyclase (GGDEF)-like protein